MHGVRIPAFSYFHCVKSVQVGSFFWSAFSCIRTEYRKIWIRKNSLFGHFSRNVYADFSNNFSNFPKASIFQRKEHRASLFKGNIETDASWSILFLLSASQYSILDKCQGSIFNTSQILAGAFGFLPALLH